MDRRQFIGGFGAAAFPWMPAEAAQNKTIPVIGLLLVGDVSTNPLIDSLKKGLRDLGWVEGETVAIVVSSASSLADLPRAAADLVSRKVDVIFANSSVYVEAARQATSTVPIVFATHADPVGLGHVASLAHPGGNITGQSQLLTELAAKQLEIARDALPTATKFGVLWDPNTPSHVAAMNSVRVTAEKLRVDTVFIPAPSAAEHEKALAAFADARADALLALQSVLTFQNRQRLAALCVDLHLPGIFGVRENVAAGGLMSYGANLAELHRRAASHIDKILRGAKAADLPVEQAEKFEFVVNLKTAKALGVEMPPTLLARADEVIE